MGRMVFLPIEPLLLLAAAVFVILVILSSSKPRRRLDRPFARTCKVCGVVLPPFARYCSRCGREL